MREMKDFIDERYFADEKHFLQTMHEWVRMCPNVYGHISNYFKKLKVFKSDKTRRSKAQWSLEKTKCSDIERGGDGFTLALA
jgi:hypothetical protein